MPQFLKNISDVDRKRFELFQTLVEIQVLIDDSEERFSEDQINSLLDLVQTQLTEQTPGEHECGENQQ